MNNDQIFALAGMFQAGSLVRDIARTGRYDSSVFETLINSILKTEANTTEEIYGGTQNIQPGLKMLANLFERNTKERDLEIARYVLGIVLLRKKLFKNKILLDKLTAGIERAKSQAEMFSPTHESVIANLAQVYIDTISQLQPRIIVSGEQGYLNNTENANRVRVLLLALMRSTVLWNQKGGSRWQLIFSRGKIINAAKKILATA